MLLFWNAKFAAVLYELLLSATFVIRPVHMYIVIGCEISSDQFHIANSIGLNKSVMELNIADLISYVSSSDDMEGF